MSIKKQIEILLDEFRSRPTLRAGSLIMTVFGDAIAPRGGTVWVGSLIDALADFGISQRLVRTSVYRLTQDDWLTVTQLGRRSFYSLSVEGARQFEHATARIYGEPRPPWSGDWCLVLFADMDAAAKDSVRKELGWQGFAPISSSVLAHPSPDIAELDATLRQTGLQQKLIVVQGKTFAGSSDDAMRELVHKSWNLADLDERYAAFLARFKPLTGAAGSKAQFEQRNAFLVRTLLIQEYRKVLLRDPLLPAELLPANWKGTAAYQMCRELYRRVYAPAEEYISEEFETADGRLPSPSAAFFNRFGGLR